MDLDFSTELPAGLCPGFSVCVCLSVCKTASDIREEELVSCQTVGTGRHGTRRVINHSYIL